MMYFALKIVVVKYHKFKTSDEDEGNNFVIFINASQILIYVQNTYQRHIIK